MADTPSSNQSDDHEKKPLTSLDKPTSVVRTPGPNPSNDSNKKRAIFDKTLGTAAGLSKLLPTGTTLAFQTMAPSFTRGGACVDHDVNFAFTCGLIIFLTLLSAALNFTDSVTGMDGKTTHYGVVTSKSLRLFNGRDLVRQSKVDKAELRKRKRRQEDALHAVVSAAVFLALAFCDAGVQGCLLKKSRPWKDFFNHLPLAVGFLATFLFIVFPTTRKGIGEDGAWSAAAADGLGDSGSDEANKKKEFEKRRAKTLLGAAATLSKLLPTGTTLAFQTMQPSFTNGGDCAGHRVNYAFTWGLIGFLALLCAALSFTDSVTDQEHHTHYGLATCNGFWLFNRGNERTLPGIDWGKLQETKRIRARDFMHAVVSSAVFVSVAFCDAGVQGCLVAEESTQWREFLALLPLAVAFLASFLFFIFPSDRKGIGEEGDAFWHLDTGTATTTKPTDKAQGPASGQNSDDQLSPGQHHHNNQISCCVCVHA